MTSNVVLFACDSANLLGSIELMSQVISATEKEHERPSAITLSLPAMCHKSVENLEI